MRYLDKSDSMTLHWQMGLKAYDETVSPLPAHFSLSGFILQSFCCKELLNRHFRLGLVKHLMQKDLKQLQSLPSATWLDMANIGPWKEKDFDFLCDSLQNRDIKTKLKCPWCGVRFLVVLASSYVGWDSMYWTGLAEDRKKWWVVMNMVVNLLEKRPTNAPVVYIFSLIYSHLHVSVVSFDHHHGARH
jgi:hypothetical protein